MVYAWYVKYVITLIWPVSGVLWLTSKDLVPLTDTLRNIRQEFRDLGLSATFAVGEYSDSSFDAELKKLQLKMRALKNAKQGEDPSPHSPFFAQCSIQSRHQANKWRPQELQSRRRLISNDSDTRLKQGKQYRDEILERFDPNRQYEKGLEDFDALKFSKSDSYISFCKADVDGLGRLLLKMKWAELGDKLKCSPEAAAREFAEAVKLVVQQALKDTITELISEDLDKKTCFPILPLVSAGDDVWVVCRRDLAFNLALRLYRYFVTGARNNIVITAAVDLFQPDEPLSLSIGVLFAKKGFPFDAQLDLAEELERSAKNYRRESKQSGGFIDYCWLESSGRESIEAARKAGYTVQDDGYVFKLTTRPWTVNDAEGVIAAARRMLSIPRRKRHQLDTILRYGYGLSDLAYIRWLSGLALNERETLDGALAELPDHLRPTDGGPWFLDKSDDSYRSCLAELAQLAEIVALTKEEGAP